MNALTSYIRAVQAAKAFPAPWHQAKALQAAFARRDASAARSLSPTGDTQHDASRNHR